MDALPKFSQELRNLLAASENPDLARQVDELKLLSRCGCGDSFCATFYTRGAPVRRSMDLDTAEGMVVVDLDETDRIVSVEVLNRNDVEQELSDALGVRRPKRLP